MLVKLSVENFKSFDQKEELSMISSSKMQGNKSHRVKIKQTQLLKNAIVYGANASGKSNLVEAFAFMKHVLMKGCRLDQQMISAGIVRRIKIVTAYLKSNLR